MTTTSSDTAGLPLCPAPGCVGRPYVVVLGRPRKNQEGLYQIRCKKCRASGPAAAGRAAAGDAWRSMPRPGGGPPPPSDPAGRQVIAVIRCVGRGLPAIHGRLALELARLIHMLALDSPTQWGNAYLRCPGCKRATDCDGDEAWDGHYSPNGIFCVAECLGCERPLQLEDLRISEGWVDWL